MLGYNELKKSGIGNVEVVAVCDINRDMAELVANEAEGLLGKKPMVFEDLDKALAHPEVLLGTHCYVVVGVASEGLEELSLSILDPGGAPILQSPTRGEEVTIGLRDALCPIEPGIYKIRARAYRGEGDYAIRVYSQQAL